VRLVIFGNSGAGKSTLARQLASRRGLAHFDLDTVAWLPDTPPARTPLGDALTTLRDFLNEHPEWVVEGCYADLLGAALAAADGAVFLDLPVALCQAHARARPWEPHKYDSPEAQDANLAMLLDWIADYPRRRDEFSHRAHEALFEAFRGPKLRLDAPLDAAQLDARLTG